MMTDVERAYLAGLIDGEGTITLTRAHKNQTPSPQISIANNSIEVLMWVRDKLGVGTTMMKLPRKPTHRVSYSWQISKAGACSRVLSLVHNFLILKKPQSKLILAKYKSVTPRNGKYTEELLAKKFELVEKIHALNQRGHQEETKPSI